MIKKYKAIFLVILMVISFIRSPVFAEWYVGGGIGLSVPHDVTDFTHDDGVQSTLTDFSVDSSFAGGIKGGYFFEKAPYFGIEVNLSFSQPESNQESVVVNNLILGDEEGLVSQESRLISYGFLGVFRTPNEYAEKHFSGFQPFVGGGVAINSLHIKEGLLEFSDVPLNPISVSSVNDTAIGLLLSAGVNYIVNDHIKLYSEYKYKDISFKFDYGGSTETFDASESSVLVGVSYGF